MHRKYILCLKSILLFQRDSDPQPIIYNEADILTFNMGSRIRLNPKNIFECFLEVVPSKSDVSIRWLIYLIIMNVIRFVSFLNNE